MTFVFLPIGSMTLDIGGLIAAHPMLIHEIGGHALAHVLYTHLRHRRRAGMSRREMRKRANRKRRWFVDNIIMHHKRLHDRNRAIVISNARTRAMARRDAKKESLSYSRTVDSNRMVDQQLKWRDAVSLRERGKELRGRTDARRLRARSRWLSVARSSNDNKN